MPQSRDLSRLKRKAPKSYKNLNTLIALNFFKVFCDAIIRRRCVWFSDMSDLKYEKTTSFYPNDRMCFSCQTDTAMLNVMELLNPFKHNSRRFHNSCDSDSKDFFNI